MPHFFVPPENINGKTFRIKGDDVHYLSAVRRCGPGDKIKIFDGKGATMLGVIETVSKDEIAGAIISQGEPQKAAARLCLYTAVPKGGRFDWLVEKCAELGVARIVPVVTQRSNIRDVSPAKLERWQRLSKAASQQCGRSELVELSQALDFEAALKEPRPGSLNLIPWEAEGSKTLKEASKLCQETKEVNIFIGPEGGFSAKEIELALKHGFSPVTLGERILRVETAGLLATVLVLDLFGEYEKK